MLAVGKKPKIDPKPVQIRPEATDAGAAFLSLANYYRRLPYDMPWQILEYLEILSRFNPDFAQAVDNLRTLANSGHELTVSGPNRRAAQGLKKSLEAKARLIQSRMGGIDGIINSLLDMASVFGCCSGEWILSDDQSEVIDFSFIHPKNIRASWDAVNQRWQYWQRVPWAIYEDLQKSEKYNNPLYGTQFGQDQKTLDAPGVTTYGFIALNPITFIYFPFDPAPASPYGTPPFVSALLNIQIQSDMQQNMVQLTKKLGLLGIVDMKIAKLDPEPDEDWATYENRLTGYLETFAEFLGEMAKDGGIVHYDDSEVGVTSAAGNAAGATAIFKQNEEQIFSGLKSMPSVQGRSYCVTPETRVLTSDLRWVQAGSLELGDELVGFDEDLGKGRGHGAVARLKPALVEQNKRISLRCLKITTDSGEITVSRQHPLVSIAHSGRVWREAKDLKVGDNLVWFLSPWEEDWSYEAGYLAGVFDGEGTIGRHGSGKNGVVGFSQKPGVVLDTTLLYLKERGFEVSQGNIRAQNASRSGVAGFRIVGGKRETWRFLGTIRPQRLLERTRAHWVGASVRIGGSARTAMFARVLRPNPHAEILRVEDVGVQEVVALQTSSRTFISEGFLSHNSTTETYAGVSYDIIIRNSAKYQRGVKRLIEGGYYLIALVSGEYDDGLEISLSFKPNRSLTRLQDAKAFQQEIDNYGRLWAEGVIDQRAFAQSLGFTDVSERRETPLTGMWYPKTGPGSEDTSTPGNQGGRPAGTGEGGGGQGRMFIFYDPDGTVCEIHESELPQFLEEAEV